MKACRGREVLFHSSLMSAQDSGGEQLHPLDTLPPTAKAPTIIGGPPQIAWLTWKREVFHASVEDQTMISQLLSL